MPLLNIEPKHPGNPKGTPGSLIRDPQLRKQIRILKQTKVLSWLKTEIYSSPEILALVLGFTHRQSVHKTLAAMEEYGLIRQGRVAIVGGHQTLWGITEHGQAMACPDPDDETSPKVFEPGRVSALRLRHILELQGIKWQAMQAGWTGWKNCDRGVKPQKRKEFKHRPDGLVIDPAGKVVAVELELTFKSIKRYAEEVIPAHARQIWVEENYHHILWVCPTATDVQRMRNLISQASEQMKRSSKEALEQLAAYREQTGIKRVFRFGSFDDWTQQWEGRREDRTANVRRERDSNYPILCESLIPKPNSSKYLWIKSFARFAPCALSAPSAPDRTNFRVLWTGWTGSIDPTVIQGNVRYRFSRLTLVSASASTRRTRNSHQPRFARRGSVVFVNPNLTGASGAKPEL